MNSRLVFDNYTVLELKGVGVGDDVVSAIDELYYNEGLKDIPIAEYDEQTDGDGQIPINGGEYWTPSLVFIEIY